MKFDRRPFQLAPHLSLKLIIGIENLDRKFVDYYYGVKPEESSIYRPEYNGKSTVIYFARINPIISINNNFDLKTNFNVRKFGKEIKNFYTVSNDIEYSMMIGIAYKTSL